VPVGLYGKLPSHGDFLHRGIRDAFVNRWDAWLQEGIAQSRLDLGERWVDIFLTSPVWRFVLSRDVIDGAAWAGVMLPSVDRVSRCFPFTIVTELAPEEQPFEVSVTRNGWFDWAETFARRLLEEQIVDLNAVQAQLTGSEPLLDHRRLGPSPALQAELPTGRPELRRFGLTADADMGRFFARLAAGLLDPWRDRVALWWSAGSELVAPMVLMSRDLPSAQAFVELLAGPVGRPAAAAPVTPPAPTASAAPAMPAAPTVPTVATPPTVPIHLLAGLSYESAAASEAGPWREENQDAFVERTDCGFWLVADGMGGHRDGSYASALIAERARAAPGGGSLAELAAGVKAILLAANSTLRSRARAESGFDAGSTVTALCLQGEQGIVLWAGDSRLYRLRQGDLQQLTRDHSIANEINVSGAATEGRSGADLSAEAHVITRAVGGADTLELDEVCFEVKAGDRLLLCTDGLYGDLTPEEITRGLSARSCRAAVDRLVSMALRHGGHDNATALCVQVNQQTVVV
jgi:type VI secretion system protein ImpM